MTTLLHDDRSLALKVGYEATDWNNPISYAEYERQLESWDVQAVVRDGECIGAIFRKNGEVHASILPKWRKRWATRGLLRAMFSGEQVKTRVSVGHEYMHDILARLGFKSAENGYFVRTH